jgi:hypothetical protein
VPVSCHADDRVEGASARSAEYRVYLLNAKGAIEVRTDFAAASDDAARTLCALLLDACSEYHAGYELWSAARHVATVTTVPATRPAVEMLPRVQQEALLGVLDGLQRSRWIVARSERLVAATSRLRRLLARDKEDA